MSRKITRAVSSAFIAGNRRAISNTITDGKALFLFGNNIAEKRKGVLYITNAGWSSQTAKERLNALPGVHISQEKGVWYLNGVRWNGNWTKIS